MGPTAGRHHPGCCSSKDEDEPWTANCLYLSVPEKRENRVETWREGEGKRVTKRKLGGGKKRLVWRHAESPPTRPGAGPQGGHRQGGGVLGKLQGGVRAGAFIKAGLGKKSRWPEESPWTDRQCSHP